MSPKLNVKSNFKKVMKVDRERIRKKQALKGAIFKKNRTKKYIKHSFKPIDESETLICSNSNFNSEKVLSPKHKKLSNSNNNTHKRPQTAFSTSRSLAQSDALLERILFNLIKNDKIEETHTEDTYLLSTDPKEVFQKDRDSIG